MIYRRLLGSDFDRLPRVLRDFHETPGGPEFWDAIVNGIDNVWREKRPAYKAKSAVTVDQNYTLTDAEKAYLASLGLPGPVVDAWLAQMNARRNIEARRLFGAQAGA